MDHTQAKLGKSLGFFSVYAIGTGTMIGAGIFVLPGIAITTAGPAASLSFLIGGLFTLATMFSVMELATSMPQAGGSYYFISRSLGPLFGTIVGLSAWLSLIFKGSFALVGLAEYFQILFHAPTLLIALTAGIFLMILNYRGAKNSGGLQNFIVAVLISILFGFVVLGALRLNTTYLFPFMPYGLSSVWQTTGIIFISYLGVTQLAAIAEEVKDPGKNIPRAFLLSVITVIALYLGVILVINGLVPLDTLKGSTTPLVEAVSIIAGPLGIVMITIAGFFATISTANAAIMSSARFPFAMARDQLMPAKLITVHPVYGTPSKAILLTSGIMFLLPFFFNVENLAKLGSTLNILIFVLINFSVFVFRLEKNESYKPTFKDPFFPVTQIIGMVGSLSLLPALGLGPFLFACSVILAGYFWYQLLGRNKIKINYAISGIIKDISQTKEPVICQNHVLVPLANPNHQKHLLALADALGDHITALTIVKVPDQSELISSVAYFENNKPQAQIQIEKTMSTYTFSYPEKCDFITVFDHDIARGILAQADIDHTSLILLGWRKKISFRYPMGAVTHDILSKSKSNVAILHGTIKRDLHHITLGFKEGDDVLYAFTLAKKIARYKGANIHLVHIMHPDCARDTHHPSPLEETMQKMCSSEQDISISYSIHERFSVIDALLEWSQKTDLLILADTTRRFKKSTLSNINQTICCHTDHAVLVVKYYEPSVQYLKYFE